MVNIEKKIEEAIRSTLVIENKQSIHLCIKAIMKCIEIESNFSKRNKPIMKCSTCKETFEKCQCK